MAIDIKAVLTAVDRTGPALKSAQDGMNELVTVARRATAALAGIFSVREVGRIADEYAGLQARLRLASRDAQEFAAANDAVRRIATASQGPLAETATLYLRIASSLKDTEVAQAAMVDTTEAVALALRISGATAAESASGMLQFSQAIASGVLRGEEFNAISESAPRLLQALAAGLGKPVGALREMAKEGKLTRDVLIDALSKQLPTLRAEAESLPQTISGAFTALGNEILLVVGEIDQATNASSTFSKRLLEIGRPAVLIVFQTLAVLGANVAFVFRVIAMEIGGMMAAMDAVRRFDFKGAFNIRKMVSEDARQARAELDALEKRIMDIGKSRSVAAPGGGGGGGGGGAECPAPAVLDTSARERAAAELALARETIDQAAKLQADDLERQIAANEAAYKLKLIDARDYYTALTELQRQQGEVEIAALRAQRALVRPGADAAEQLRAKQELLRIDTQIELVRRRMADQAVANAQAESAINREALTNAQQLVDGLQQEAFLLGLTNDERARAVALLELEKLAVGLTADEYKRLRAALDEALDTRAAAEARQKALEDAKKQAEEIRTALTQNLQRSVTDVLDNAFTGDGARGAVQSFVDFLRTSLSNVISAKLTEQILGMLDGGTVQSIGGFLGLGKARDGSNPASAIYVQDVAAAGVAGAGLSAGGDAAGGGFLSGVFDQVKSFFSGIASFVSGLFSRVSSLFSGGGGGGGLFSAIGSLFGFAEGGYTGPGGKYQPAGVVHAGEYVFNASAVRNLGVPVLDWLHRVSAGIAPPRMPRMGYADGGMVSLPSQAAPTVNSSTRIVNLFDPSQVAGQLGQTREFERAVLNVIQLNPSVLR